MLGNKFIARITCTQKDGTQLNGYNQVGKNENVAQGCYFVSREVFTFIKTRKSFPVLGPALHDVFTVALYTEQSSIGK